MVRARFVPLLALAITFAAGGCMRDAGGGRWPSLAPRPGEISPLVPRTPLGACAGCGADVFTTALAPAPAPVVVPPPADASARLDAIAAAIAVTAAKLPPQRAAADAARAAARDAAGDSTLASTAEVERSRLEALYLPLAEQARALDVLDDDLAGKANADLLLERLAALRSELAKLESERAGADPN